MTPTELAAIRERNAARDGMMLLPRRGDLEALLNEVERLRRALEAARIGCTSEECRVELLSYDTACGCDESRDRDKHNAAITAALEG